MNGIKQNIINVFLVTSNNCKECDALEIKLKRLVNKIMYFKLSVLKKDDFNSKEDMKIVITPALIVNDKLMFYGDVPERKLNEILSNQIKN